MLWSLLRVPFQSTVIHSANTNVGSILLFATTWMNLKDIILREMSQAQKDKYHIISFIYGI
jgi:hypothetical protein